MILHVDCNSFYASCEQAFRPDLRNKPVVVLSNNDGILVALNKEAKAVGLKRGDAFFQVKPLIEKEKVAVFSSNYTLYADISQRIHKILFELCPEVEVYSIDECFLFFPEIKQINDIATTIKQTIEEATGIPVSIGIAPTKTLSKIANKLAKKTTGVLNVKDVDIDSVLKSYPVEDIWGIGHQYAVFLYNKDIHTAYDLKQYPLHLAKQNLTIRGYYTVQELNSFPMIDYLVAKLKRNIISSKGFSHLVERIEDLEEATADYCIEAVKKLRSQHSATKSIGVTVLTNRFRKDLPQYYNNIVYEISPPSSYLPYLIKMAIKALHEVYKPGYKYQKVVILMIDLVPEERQQLDFFEKDTSKEKALMNCFDKINKKYGSHTLFIGAKGINQDWTMKRGFLSPLYTTSIADIPKVK